MLISIIVAMDENRAIGREGGLPWHLPADMRRFRALTMGHFLILGRRTYESVRRPLPGRNLVVVSRTLQGPLDDAAVARSLPEALELAREAGETDVFIGGGAAIYAEALPVAHRIYLTLVHARLTGDTFFPAYEKTVWRQVWLERYPADEAHPYSFDFQTLERVGT